MKEFEFKPSNTQIPRLDELGIDPQRLGLINHQSIKQFREMFLQSPDPISPTDTIGALKFLKGLFLSDKIAGLFIKTENIAELLDDEMRLPSLIYEYLEDQVTDLDLQQFLKATAIAIGRKDDIDQIINSVVFMATINKISHKDVDTRKELEILIKVLGVVDPNSRLQSLITPGTLTPDPATLHQWLIGEMIANPLETFQSGYAPKAPILKEIQMIGEKAPDTDPLVDICPRLQFYLNIPKPMFSSDKIPALLKQVLGLDPETKDSYTLTSSNHAYDIHNKQTALAIYDELVKLGLLETFHFDSKDQQYYYQTGQHLHVILVEQTKSLPKLKKDSIHFNPSEYLLTRHLLDATGLANFPDYNVMGPYAEKIDTLLANSDHAGAQKLLTDAMQDVDQMFNAVNYPEDAKKAEEKLTQILLQYDHRNWDMSMSWLAYDAPFLQVAEFNVLNHRYPLTSRWLLQYVHSTWTCFSLLAKQKEYLNDTPIYQKPENQDALIHASWPELPMVAHQIAETLPNISKTNPYLAEYQLAAMTGGLQLVAVASAIKSRFGLNLETPWTEQQSHKATGHTLGAFKLFGQVVISKHIKPRIIMSLLNGLSHRNVIELLDTYHLSAHRGHDLTHLTIGGVEHLSPAHAVLYLMETIDQQLDVLEQKIRFARDTELFDLMSKNPDNPDHHDTFGLKAFCLRWKPDAFSHNIFEFYKLLVADYRRRHSVQTPRF